MIHLVADIGGTHARFALVDRGGSVPIHERTLKTGSFPGIVDAIRHYLEDLPGSGPLQACIAVACPVGGDAISLTNNDWTFSIAETRKALGLTELRVVNDFKALAAAVPGLGPDERIQIGDGHPLADHPASVLGPGTGFGVATITHMNKGYSVLDGEGGHVGFAPANEREAEILRILSKRYDRVSIERILSGPGISELHTTLATVDGVALPELETPIIIERAVEGSCVRCRDTIDVFCGILGSFAGDVALTTGSRGGVYIGGGIAPRIVSILDQGPFRSRFEAKGRMSPFVTDIPTYLITATNPALRGAAMLLGET